MSNSPRDRRLQADYQGIQQLLNDSTILNADARGNPPTQYRFRFRGWGLMLGADGLPLLIHDHQVTVELGAAYPRLMPSLIWQTPIFHPNISANGIVCLGGYGTHWVPSLTLSELCSMLWDIVRYQNFDPNSPYNREAAYWVREQTQFHLPLDPRPLRDLVAQQSLFRQPLPTDDPVIIEEGIEIVQVDSAPPSEIVFL